MLPPGENAGNADEQTADAGVRDMLSFLIAVLELLLGDREQGGAPGVRRGTRRQGEVSSRHAFSATGSFSLAAPALDATCRCPSHATAPSTARSPCCRTRTDSSRNAARAMAATRSRRA